MAMRERLGDRLARWANQEWGDSDCRDPALAAWEGEGGRPELAYSVRPDAVLVLAGTYDVREERNG